MFNGSSNKADRRAGHNTSNAMSETWECSKVGLEAREREVRADMRLRENVFEK
jgi:hypothetical protein